MEKVALAVLPTLVGGLFNKKDSPAPAPAAPKVETTTLMPHPMAHNAPKSYATFLGGTSLSP